MLNRVLIVSALVIVTYVPSIGHSESNPASSMAEFCKSLPRPEYAKLEQLKSPDDWFELYRVSPGVTAIYEPHQWQEVISYLIEGTERALLFDTGNGIADIASVAKGLTDKPISVLNSHSHYDHVGGNYAFTEIDGLDTPFTRSRQSGHKNSEIAIEASSQALCRELPAGLSEKNHIGRPYQISRFLQPGHVFELGERRLELLHIPGHTPDAIALIDREAKLMWTGDSYYSGPIWLFAPETDLSKYRESLLKLITESDGVDFLLPAHNTPKVSASILPNVLEQFDAMLAGKLTATPLGDGMVEYRSKSKQPFSFLMRDETLPYVKKPLKQMTK